jgi:plastocyanin
MANVTVTVRIDKKGERVTLSPNEALPRPDTFRVKPGDTLTWDLRDGQGNSAPPPPGFEAVITFVEFPKGSKPPRPLLAEGNTLRTAGPTMSGTVSDQAFKGHYRYRVDLASASEKINLVCFWSIPAQPPVETGMGGGENSAGPLP